MPYDETLRAPPLEFVVRADPDLDIGDLTVRPGAKLEFDLDNFGGSGSVRVFWLGGTGAGRTSDSHISPAERPLAEGHVVPRPIQPLGT